ncbi:MAG: hypothetical protein WBA28_07130 [Microbacteriaceae bacterium]
MQPESFEFTPEIERYSWLQERFREPDEASWTSLYHVIPDGYPAYARIFHPASRTKLLGELTWQQLDADTQAGIYHYPIETVDEAIRWSEIANVFGTVMHPGAQSYRLMRLDVPDNQSAYDAEGWRYEQPRQGSLDAAQLHTLAQVLSEHTAASEPIITAIWEGWGGLTSSSGSASFGWYSGPFGKIQGWAIRQKQRIAARLPHRQAKPGSGLLDVEAASGPRLELPNRNYVLFATELALFVDDSWIGRAPWLRGNEIHDPQTPSLIWPENADWVLATEIDFDSTLVAGSRELIDAILQHPELEALEISINQDLTYGGDTINAAELAE